MMNMWPIRCMSNAHLVETMAVKEVLLQANERGLPGRYTHTSVHSFSVRLIGHLRE